MIEARGIGKRFGGVRALDEIDLTIERNEIHALVGENGAGKSTLGKIIAGILRLDEGELLVDSQPVRYASPHDALRDGITAIQQEIALVPMRSVIENVFLNIEHGRAGFVDNGSLRRRFDELRAETKFDLRPNDLVASLSLADQQKVEIMRALAREARVIVFDEPTAALTADESSKLLDIVRSLRDRGATIIYVSHFLTDVLSLSDRVTVLRNGRLVRTANAAEETPASLVEGMLGRSMSLAFPDKEPPAADAPSMLEVSGLQPLGGGSPVSLEVRAGEIVGLAGLVGSGRSEVARAIFGADPSGEGSVKVNGNEIRGRHPKHAIRAGLALVPESRKDQGLLMRLSARTNTTLAHLSDVTSKGVVSTRREAAESGRLLTELGLVPNRPERRVDTFSGGNQQKVLFGKWLFRRPLVLIADEPTRGVDVGAKIGIYELLVSLARGGLGILLISSEIEEVLGLSHRVLVMRQGSIVAEFDGGAIREDAVMHAAFGTTGEEAA